MLTRIVLGVVFSLALLPQNLRDYPTKPVRIIEPFGAGGGPDLTARALSPKLSELWGQPVTVEKAQRHADRRQRMKMSDRIAHQHQSGPPATQPPARR